MPYTFRTPQNASWQAIAVDYILPWKISCRHYLLVHIAALLFGFYFWRKLCIHSCRWEFLMHFATPDTEWIEFTANCKWGLLSAILFNNFSCEWWNCKFRLTSNVCTHCCNITITVLVCVHNVLFWTAVLQAQCDYYRLGWHCRNVLLLSLCAVSLW